MLDDLLRPGDPMETLRQDLRYVARSFARTPGFFFVTALTLALGIGAATAIFSVVNGVLLRPLPYPESDRIVQLFAIDKTGKRSSVSEANFPDWKSQTHSFASIALVSTPSTITVTGLAEPVRARATSVTRDFFAVFGVKPELGRLFADEELHVGAAPTVIVSDAFRTKYFGDASPVGKTLRVDGALFTVVGVMPAYMDYPAGNELWMPHELDTPNPNRTSGGWRAVARLAPGVSIVAALQDLSTVSKRLKQQFGDDTWMSDAELVGLRDQLVGGARPALLVLLGASAFLLLIACGNVVNLLVARMTMRRAEIGVRLALGAGRARLAQQFLTESAVLALAGGLGGLLLAIGGVRMLLSMQTGSLPRAGEIHVDLPVLGFAFGISVVTALALGLLSAWHGTRSDIRETLSSSQRTQAGTGSGARIRRTLVVSQMALTVVLLVGAGILGRSFLRLLEIDPGYRTQHAVVLDAELPYENGPEGAQQRVAFYNDLMTRLSAIPGVTKVGGATGVPLVGGGSDGAFIIMNSPDEQIHPQDFQALMKNPARSGYANYMVVDGNYFDAMSIPVLRGRAFTNSDVVSAPHVAVISASLAKAKWPNENPIGKTIQYGNMDGDLRPFTIVGVVGDVRDQSLASPPQPTFYAYLPQRSHSGGVHVVMQTAGDPTTVMTSARAVVRQLRPDVPPVLRTIETIVATSVADRRFLLVLVGVFGTAALVLATLGVYSVISYLVAQRRAEIGVRIALGAQRADVLSLVLRQGALLAFIGIAIGTAGALFLTRLLSGLVFDVSTTDPVAFGGVIALLAAVALAASWIPAQRATRVDPMNVLRSS
ncbi:MAG TPA: ABC transporter permease [Gemmatimonadaceae bacterium]|jgi:predicted permease